MLIAILLYEICFKRGQYLAETILTTLQNVSYLESVYFQHISQTKW